MPIDKSRIVKGAFLTGGECPASFKHADDALRREYPEFEGVLKAAGPRPSPERLAELAEERRALEQRMADLKARIAALRARK
ncbi:hypothetical protein AAFX91_27965 [Bradyrhizobium sp. 31Argb]|uniref:hypothetical protein n=1 Tax=Bradyrhizobium sp. 31Argb TaxID=3141247 RepID=UPI0037483A8E